MMYPRKNMAESIVDARKAALETAGLHDIKRSLASLRKLRRRLRTTMLQIPRERRSKMRTLFIQEITRLTHEQLWFVADQIMEPKKKQLLKSKVTTEQLEQLLNEQSGLVGADCRLYLCAGNAGFPDGFPKSH